MNLKVVFFFLIDVSKKKNDKKTSSMRVVWSIFSLIVHEKKYY